MTSFLKGNYDLPSKTKMRPKGKKPAQSLTEQFEESALAKLGGSMCFVMKEKTFIWTGDESETPSP